MRERSFWRYASWWDRYKGDERVETRHYGTTKPELEDLRAWLQQEGITHVVMESTGSYWKPDSMCWKRR